MNLDVDALIGIGWPARDSWPAGWKAVIAEHRAARPARVTEQHRSGYVVAESIDDAQTAESLPDWQRPRCEPTSRAAVGDWVMVEGEAGKVRIVALLPRLSVIKRAAAGEHYKQQLIAANVDTAFVVTGLDADFNVRRIERYLLLLKGGGVEPVVVLTKQDIANDAPGAVAALAMLAEQDIAVRSVNAREADSVAALHPWLGAGKTVVLVGSSGAGKSTLTNTLLGRTQMKTAAVRESDARGRHTTTHRALIAMPQGACLIDTPGMRELKPTGEEQLDEAAFADVEAVAAQCRFRDCQHENEPGCALREAVERGELEPGRFANYLKLRDELAAAAQVLEARLAKPVEVKRSPKRPATRRNNDQDDYDDDYGSY